jgi:integrase
MADKLREAKKLTAALLNSSLAPGRYHDGGNLGLFLRVDPNGARFWIQRISIKGKVTATGKTGRAEMGLGSYPLVSLADARARATINKSMAMQGGDPLEAKRKARDAMTFAQAVEHVLTAKGAEFRSEKHKKQWRATLDTYAAPILGPMLLPSIEARHVLRVLQPIWTEKTETASRLRGRIEAVLSWATVAGHRTGDNPARWKGNLAELLPKPGKVAEAGNHPARTLSDLPRWWAELDRREGMAARALQFALMCCARSGEVRGMTWAEVDFGDAPGATHATRATSATRATQGAIWTVPAGRMKADREHRVPLTPEAVALLEALPRVKGTDLVFFAPQGGMLSDMSLSAVMRRMQETELKRLAEADKAAGIESPKGPRGFVDARSGRAAVPHGLRSTFRDWAAEHGIDRDLAEMALAHSVGSEVERAYRRSDMLERRRALMETWGQAVRGVMAGGNVVRISQGAAV